VSHSRAARGDFIHFPLDRAPPTPEGGWRLTVLPVMWASSAVMLVNYADSLLPVDGIPGLVVYAQIGAW
jgi:hypothetical protein